MAMFHPTAGSNKDSNGQGQFASSVEAWRWRGEGAPPCRSSRAPGRRLGPCKWQADTEHRVIVWAWAGWDGEGLRGFPPKRQPPARRTTPMNQAE